MPALLLALVSSFVKKVVDTVRYATAKDWSAVGTQVVAWGAGIGATFLLVHQNLVSHMTVAGFPLDRANGAAVALLGLMVGSGGSLAMDFIKAFDTPNESIPPKL